MRNVGSFIGSAIAGVFVFSIWSKFVAAYGLMGGWLAAMVTIGVAAVMNHGLGVIDNKEGAAWVDMGLGIGIAGTCNGLFQGMSIVPALPTLGFVAVGAICGGIAAALIEKAINKDTEIESNT